MLQMQDKSYVPYSLSAARCLSCCFYIVSFSRFDLMKARIQKWGNSMAIRIPKVVLEELGCTAEQEVEMLLVEGELRIRPIATTPKYALEQLVHAITAKNRHALLDDDAPTGKEVW